MENLSCHFSAQVDRSFYTFLLTLHTCIVYYFEIDLNIISIQFHINSAIEKIRDIIYKQ